MFKPLTRISLQKSQISNLDQAKLISEKMEKLKSQAKTIYSHKLDNRSTDRTTDQGPSRKTTGRINSQSPLIKVKFYGKDDDNTQVNTPNDSPDFTIKSKRLKKFSVDSDEAQSKIDKDPEVGKGKCQTNHVHLEN